MTSKSPDTCSRRSGAARHRSLEASVGDRCETALTYSFLASDAPGWTAITGASASCIDGGPSHNEEPSS